MGYAKKSIMRTPWFLRDSPPTPKTIKYVQLYNINGDDNDNSNLQCIETHDKKTITYSYCKKHWDLKIKHTEDKYLEDYDIYIHQLKMHIMIILLVYMMSG